MASGNKSFYHCVVRIIAYDLFSDILKMCIKKSRSFCQWGAPHYKFLS